MLQVSSEMLEWGGPFRQLSTVSGFRDFYERARKRGEAELLPRCALPAVPSRAADEGGRHFGCYCLSCPVLSTTWLGWEWPVYCQNPAVQPSSGTDPPSPARCHLLWDRALAGGPWGCAQLSVAKKLIVHFVDQGSVAISSRWHPLCQVTLS